MTYDLLIRGGTVVDPSQGLNAVRDVGLSDGKVAALEDAIPEGEASEVVDATGLVVTPGLIDLHVHAYWGASRFGIEPDIGNVSKGVTTAVDAGSSGARTFPGFRRYVMERVDTRLFALLNISSMGMTLGYGGLEDKRWADVEDAVQAGRENREYVLGIKARIPPVSHDDYVDILKRALEAAEAIGGFLMLHLGGTAIPVEERLSMLRPGDVLTHCFRGATAGGILDDAGRVLDGAWEARERGVVFDVGHGGGSFSLDTADKAMSQGFPPDNISSDLHIGNYEGPVFDLVTTLSKFMWLGMSLDDVIRLSTETTARIIGKGDKLGTLKVGAEGDVAILRLDEGRFTLTDSGGRSVEARRRLSHVRTVKGGRVYRPWLR